MSENKEYKPQSSGNRRGMFGGPRHGMGMPVEKAKNFKGTFKRLTNYFKPEMFNLVVVVIFAILSTIFSIITPKIMGMATTKLFEGITKKSGETIASGIDFKYIFYILVICGVLYIISSIFSYVMQYIMAATSQNIVYSLRNEVYGKLNRLPLKYFDSKTHGEIMSRVTNDIDNISGTLQQSLTQLITSICTIVGVLLMMLLISPILTLIVLLTLPLSVFITAVVAKKSQKNFMLQQKELGNLNGHVEEMFTGHKIVKAFGREEKSVKEFVDINNRLYEAGWKAQFISGIIMPIMTFVSNIGYVLVSVVGAIMILQRGITIGDVQAFIQYSRQFMWPLAQAANIANVLQSTIASAERVFEVMDEQEEEKDRDDVKIIKKPVGKIDFKNVKFGYTEERILMENMNIRANAGDTIAIVGPTGAGKTTLVNLLMRFYEINSGEISVDGVDIVNLNRGKLRRMFGMVLQDTWLFNGTILENIRYGNENATREEIYEAAKAAHADHFIRALPNGYDTILNEDATNISQGEKQLITIARAILSNPAILILDEATSSVDTRTEVLLQKAMAVLMKGRTSFVIAHRLSTIRDAKTILVMNNGSIIEQGNHKELIELGGFYKELYNSQFTGAYI